MSLLAAETLSQFTVLYSPVGRQGATMDIDSDECDKKASVMAPTTVRFWFWRCMLGCRKHQEAGALSRLQTTGMDEPPVEDDVSELTRNKVQLERENTKKDAKLLNSLPVMKVYQLKIRPCERLYKSQTEPTKKAYLRQANSWQNMWMPPTVWMLPIM